MAAKTGQRRWGHIRKLDSGRFQASFVGPDLRRYKAPRPFDTKLMAEGWLAREREMIQLADYNGTKWTSPVERQAKAAVRGETVESYGTRWIEGRNIKRPSGVDPARVAALRRQRARRVTRAGVKTAAVAGSAAVATVAVVSQSRPSSRTRTAPARRRIERAYVARAKADHAKLRSLRASAFPTSAIGASTFDARSARAEARALTSGYRQQVKAARRVRR
ncbi:hypothetical protein BVC93_04940 [Mycobacterium sp. MS1601]|nr:hypothetical protein BVC93_04940 [Mycobacterium sp. MS1601]